MGAVDRDIFLSAFWLALFAGMMTSGLLMLCLYRATRDVVGLMFGISALWLAGAFFINLFIRALSPNPEMQLALVAWQRSCFAVTVVFVWLGVDAMVRSHNGQVPRIRKLLRPWEATD